MESRPKPKLNIKWIFEKLGAAGITRIILMVILVVFLALVYRSASAEDVPMEDIEAALLKKTKMGQMEKCTNRKLMQFIGLDYSDYDSYVYYKSTEALSVDELLVVKAYDRDDLQAVQTAVEDRVDDQITTFEGYGPEQVALLKDAVIYKRGNYIFCCVGADADKCEGVFKRAI